MFLFFLLQKFDHFLKNCMYSSQLCNFLCRKQYIINIITENKSCYKYSFAETDVTLPFFTFLNVKTLKNKLFKKKINILDKFQWSHEKCSYFPMQRLDCSYFFVYLRLAYVLMMFLFLKKNKPLCSYKHGSYKKKNV